MQDDRRLDAGAGPVLGDAPELAAKRQWTLMLYMAGDNNLESYGREDLDEIKMVGSSDQVAVVAQFDRMAEGSTRRYYLQHGTPLQDDEVVCQPLGETNSGDPRNLALFVEWGIRTYPAEHYGLVLWNHGTGWKDDDIYDIAVDSGLDRLLEPRRLSRLIKRLVKLQQEPPIFKTTLGAILAKGIAFDDTSLDFLDNSELKRGLDAGLLFAGVERLSMLGFDACLMSMVEVAYQVRDQAEYLVGSQETEPGEGWPYATILQALSSNPTMTPAQLGATISDCYVAAYDEGGELTQSVLDLALCEALKVALDSFCEYVIEYQPECEFIIGRAARKAQSFADADYKDLGHFCKLVVQYANQVPELQQRAQAVLAFLEPAGEGAFVVAEQHCGARTGEAHGVSIYFPTRTVSPFYQRLDFAVLSRWDDMLQALIGG